MGSSHPGTVEFQMGTSTMHILGDIIASVSFIRNLLCMKHSLSIHTVDG